MEITDVTTIDQLTDAEVDELLARALNPRTPIEIFYAVLDRIGGQPGAVDTDAVAVATQYSLPDQMPDQMPDQVPDQVAQVAQIPEQIPDQFAQIPQAGQLPQLALPAADVATAAAPISDELGEQDIDELGGHFDDELSEQIPVEVDARVRGRGPTSSSFAASASAN